MRISSTLSLRSSSASSRASCSCSSDMDRLDDLVRVDLPEGRAALVARDLALGRVLARDGEERGGAELLGDGLNPLRELREPLLRRAHTAGVEVDHLAAEPVPDGPPQVLLDQAVGMEREPLTLVERARHPRDERVDERSERLRSAELGLTVADPQLDGR